MEIKINPNKNNMVHWAFCEAIGEQHEQGAEIIKNAKQDENGFIFDIELKINGVEFNFENIVNSLIENESITIEKEIKERLKDKFYDIINKANECIENIDCVNVELEKNI